MTDPISTNNRINSPNQTHEQRAKNTAKAPSAAGSTEHASAIVDLSSNKILDQINKLPEVDNNRIESIKAALANGEYQPDPEVIARKFSEIENLLP